MRNLDLAESLLLPSVLKGFSHTASSLGDALILRQYYFSNIDYLYLYLSLMINKILKTENWVKKSKFWLLSPPEAPETPEMDCNIPP